MIDLVKAQAEDSLAQDIQKLVRLRERYSSKPEMVEFIDLCCLWQSRLDGRVRTFLGMEDSNPVLFPGRLFILVNRVFLGDYRVVWTKRVWLEDMGAFVECISDVECPDTEPRLEENNDHYTHTSPSEILNEMRKER